MESGELPPVGGLGGFPRGSVRTFLARFDGAVLEVALEATTGWRFLVEEIQRVGAEAHLAEPAETSGLKGKKQRAKTDWADARHLRELLLIGRLPESWIAPAHLLDLRARVRCRHTLVHQRTEWQQRMHAVLYHHGVPHARKLLTLANRERIAALKLPAAAREQLTIATEMIDAIEIQIGPVDLALRAIARTQPGCRTLIDQIYGIGPLTSVTILAELSELSALDAQHHGETLLAMLVGGLFGLLSAFTVVETSPRQLAATMVLAPIPMLAAMDWRSNSWGTERRGSR
jgi:transposase